MLVTTITPIAVITLANTTYAQGTTYIVLESRMACRAHCWWFDPI